MRKPELKRITDALKQLTPIQESKMGSDTIIVWRHLLSWSAYPFGCSLSFAQFLNMSPELLATQRPSLMRAIADRGEIICCQCEVKQRQIRCLPFNRIKPKPQISSCATSQSALGPLSPWALRWWLDQG